MAGEALKMCSYLLGLQLSKSNYAMAIGARILVHFIRDPSQIT
ncbi:MAG TPA: hypothetical protein VGY56_19695 [Verrucomicrobiae bacterium]|nr:hypothetical protein [Verrucomicrobiae bacterium]